MTEGGSRLAINGTTVFASSLAYLENLDADVGGGVAVAAGV